MFVEKLDEADFRLFSLMLHKNYKKHDVLDNNLVMVYFEDAQPPIVVSDFDCRGYAGYYQKYAQRTFFREKLRNLMTHKFGEQYLEALSSYLTMRNNQELAQLRQNKDHAIEF